jgi:solute carrier family 35
MCLGFSKVSTNGLKSKMFHFSLIVLSFVGGVYANIITLQHLNVETVIVFRSCTVLCVCAIETAFMDRDLPSAKSLASLLCIFFLTVVYVDGDVHFNAQGYAWLSIWFFLLVFSMTYVKHVCDAVRLETWEQVLFTNGLSIPLTFSLLYFTNEVDTVRNIQFSHRCITVLLLSCLFGVGISYSSYYIRSELSATSFDLLGIVCKFMSAFLNVALGLRHASPRGLLCLLAIVIAAYFYKQAPLKNKVQAR